MLTNSNIMVLKIGVKFIRLFSFLVHLLVQRLEQSFFN